MRVVRDVFAGQHFGVVGEDFDARVVVDERNGSCGSVGAEADVDEVFGTGDGSDGYHVVPAWIILVRAWSAKALLGEVASIAAWCIYLSDPFLWARVWDESLGGFLSSSGTETHQPSYFGPFQFLLAAIGCTASFTLAPVVMML